jgi:hypothetical protein
VVGRVASRCGFGVKREGLQVRSQIFIKLPTVLERPILTMSLSAWALGPLQKLLPIDDDSLLQILEYSSRLSKPAAANHLKNLLGDSPEALDFINSFNARREPVRVESHTVGTEDSAREDGPPPPVPKARQKKKKASDLKKPLAPRQVEGHGDIAGGYVKGEVEDYLSARPMVKAAAHRPPHASLSSAQKARHLNEGLLASDSSPQTSTPSSPKLPPSAAGRLISDSKKGGNSSASGKSKAVKVSITGGTPMKGQSTALTDLEYAIQSLEIQTNPTLAPTKEDNSKRRCNCMATRHALLAAAPNCLNCGKIICVKEGLGPCTFCHNPLLSHDEILGMIRFLKDERGKEKMAANNSAHKRAEVSKMPRPFSGSHNTTPGSSQPASEAETDKLAAAERHRDKLLAFQAQNARRTRVHDEAADFETPETGQSMWASPEERAKQLKRQQRALREQEWHARPEWEKRRIVASIDLAGGKVVRKFEKMKRPQTSESSGEDEGPLLPTAAPEKHGGFGRNPLLGALIRPVAKVESAADGSSSKPPERWRRVQDDNDDNERWILDGASNVDGGREEPENCG